MHRRATEAASHHRELAKDEDEAAQEGERDVARMASEGLPSLLNHIMRMSIMTARMIRFAATLMTGM